MKLIIILACIFVYIICVLLSYKYFQKAFFHPHGCYKHRVDNSSDIAPIIQSLTPGINLIIAFMYLGGGWRDSSYKKERYSANLFKPNSEYNADR